MYKVLITTSGTGSRLKDLTKTTNKSLVEINGKKVIDYIISSYPRDTSFVFTIGYFGDLVKNYLSQTYPDRKMEFIKIDKFEGPGSSLGYSMLQAKNSLQCPFVFHCNDTIVSDTIPSPEANNWNGVSKGIDSTIYNTASYSTVLVKENKVTAIQDKEASTWDYFHIGLVGIKDFNPFWQTLQALYDQNPQVTTLNDCSAITQLLQDGYIFKPVIFKEWHDTGNFLSFGETKQNIH